MAWQRSYDGLPVTGLAPSHDGGYVLVGRERDGSDYEEPVQINEIDEEGAVRQREEIPIDLPKESAYASVDVVQTEDGYAIASGPWLATLDADLSVETTDSDSDVGANSTSLLIKLADGYVVAIEDDTPNHISTNVLSFDASGEHRWTRTYGEYDSRWLNFLFEDSDGGPVVGGTPGPWLAGLGSDGSERWQTNFEDAPPELGRDATRDGDGIVLLGESDLVRLESSRSIDWGRSYEDFRDTHHGRIATTEDGGYILAADVGDDRIRVGKTGSDGQLAWSHEYAVGVDGIADLNGVIETSPGEYLVVGARRDDQQGWAMAFLEMTTPTPMPTPTSTPPGTPSPSMTDSTATPSSTGTTTGLPGFGVVAALVGIAGWLLARHR